MTIGVSVGDYGVAARKAKGQRGMFIAILKSVIRTGSLRVTDAVGRSHIVGDGSIPRATIRLTSKRLEYSLFAQSWPKRVDAVPITRDYMVDWERRAKQMEFDGAASHSKIRA